MPGNKLNDLDPKAWLKFQKSWFINNPTPRKKGVLVHPAKFPETMAQGFIEFFTKKVETVLDPMAGTGSTLVAALRAGRNSFGIELNPKYARIAQRIIEQERAQIRASIENRQSTIANRQSEIDNRQSKIANRQSEIENPKSEIANRQSKIANPKSEITNRQSKIDNRQSEIDNRQSIIAALKSEIIIGDAADALHYGIPTVDYILTSPPYWDMLHARGAANQKKRRAADELDVVYSEDPNDLGNVHEYEEFLSRLVSIYSGLKPLLRGNAYLTIIVKNVKKGGRIYPLAWDLARELGKTYTLKDEKIWLQDNQAIAPYGLGSAWVSNTFHHYCLQFRNE